MGKHCLKQLDVAPYDSECFRPQVFKCFKTAGPRVLVISVYDGASAVMCALMQCGSLVLCKCLLLREVTRLKFDCLEHVSLG